jgi:serine/threonine protein kinase
LRREIDSLLDGDARAGGVFARRHAGAAGRRRCAPRASRRARRYGPYVLVEEIASGGMGTVWRAERADREYERVVAIKVLRPTLDSGSVLQRFEHERRTMARLEHPNIAQLLRRRRDVRRIAISSSWSSSTASAIDTYCDEQRLSVRERLELVRTVALAVHALTSASSFTATSSPRTSW